MLSDEERIRECVSIALADTIDEEEVLSSWEVCLEDAFDDLKQVEVLGEVVDYAGLVQIGNHFFMKVKNGKKKAKVSLTSVRLLKASKEARIWKKAYISYLKYR